MCDHNFKNETHTNLISTHTHTHICNISTLTIEEKVSARPNLNLVGRVRSKLDSLLIRLPAIIVLAKSCSVGIDLVTFTV